MEGRDDASMLDDEADTDSDFDTTPFQVPEGLRVSVDSPKEFQVSPDKIEAESENGRTCR